MAVKNVLSEKENREQEGLTGGWLEGWGVIKNLSFTNSSWASISDELGHLIA